MFHITKTAFYLKWAICAKFIHCMSQLVTFGVTGIKIGATCSIFEYAQTPMSLDSVIRNRLIEDVPQ